MFSYIKRSQRFVSDNWQALKPFLMGSFPATMNLENTVVASTVLVKLAIRSASGNGVLAPILFDANLEAILSPEFLQPGKGDCFNKDFYRFTTSALFLPCEVCRFYYGVPIDPWSDGTCN